MSSSPIGPKTALRDLGVDAAYELFVDAGLAQPWEIPAMKQDDRSLAEVCEIGDLDLEEILFLIRQALQDAGARALVQAQQNTADDA